MARRRNVLTLVIASALGAAAAAPPSDREAPAPQPPRNLIVLPRSETETTLALLWDKPADPAGVAGYEVVQDGSVVATTEPGRTFYGATGLSPGRSYSYRVVSRDASGRRSAPSAAVTTSARTPGVVIDVSTAPYNARGDGTSMNTAAIQKAVDACPAGGTVRIPAGTFLTGPIVLKSEMSLYVARGGVLKGSTDPAHYLPMIRTRYMGVECDCYQPLIRVGTMDHDAGYTTRDVTLLGEGEIRGGGETLGVQQSYDHRSRLVLIQNCQNVAIMGLRLTYPAGWTVHPLYSDNVTAWDVRIESWDAQVGKSGDGFDPDSSTNCYLVNSYLHTWDNSFGPKSGRGLEGYQIARPTRHVRAVGCVFQGGAPCVGSEVSGGIEDVTIRDSTIIGSYVYVKTNDGRGAYIKDFVMEDVTFTRNHSKSIWIDTNCQMRNRPPKAPPYTACSGFVFQNQTGCGNVIIDGGFGLPDGPPRPFHVRDVRFSNVQMRRGSSVTLQYCDGVRLDGVRCPDGGPPEYTLTGVNHGVTSEGRALTP
jgi:exo-poly-alpha-galacturonosidase